MDKFKTPTTNGKMKMFNVRLPVELPKLIRLAAIQKDISVQVFAERALRNEIARCKGAR